MAEFSFDAEGMDALTEDLDLCLVSMRVETDKTLIEVGELVKATGQEIARQAGSTSIPPTIKSKPAPGYVEVTAGSAEVPLAALWDEGNKGRSKRKTFWHPVYGHRVPGAVQERHPILRRARLLCRPMINDMMLASWDRGTEPLHRGGGDS